MTKEEVGHMSGVVVSIRHWRELAEEMTKMAIYEERMGRVGVGYRNKAATCEQTARALELEVETGKPHCVCCLKPRR